MVLTGRANAPQDPAASLSLVLLNHGQHSSPRPRSSRRPPPERGREGWSGPSRPPRVAYRRWGQMKVLQLAKNVRELSPMNSVAE